MTSSAGSDVEAGNSRRQLEQLAEALVTTHGCLILPGLHFPSQDAAAYRSFFRFGIGRKNFGECLEQLDQALRKELAPS